MKALIVVDLQNDFVTGSLRVPGAEKIADEIAHYIAEHGGDYDYLISTQDWHIEPNHHFSDEPDYENTWPVHCKATTWGAELHKAIENVPFSLQVRKGHYSAAYSGFEGFGVSGWTLHFFLEEKNVDEVDIVGLAFDHCVAATAIDAISLGLKTRVLTNYTAAVSSERQNKVLEELTDVGVELID